MRLLPNKSLSLDIKMNRMIKKIYNFSVYSLLFFCSSAVVDNHLPLNYNSNVAASIFEQVLGVLVTNISRVIVSHLGDDVTPMKDTLDGGAKSDLARTKQSPISYWHSRR